MIVTGNRGLGKSRFLGSASRMSVKLGLEVLRLNGAGLSGISLNYFLDELSGGALEEFARRWSDWTDSYSPGKDPAGPAVIAIDDMDWASTVMSGSRHFHSVAEQLGRPLVIVMSLSSDAKAAVFTTEDEAYQQAGKAMDVVCCRLLPLPRDEVERLTADALGMPPGPEIMGICDYAAGVPAQLMTVLDGVREAGVVCAPDGTAKPDFRRVLPSEVRALAFPRLDGLSEGTRRMLDIASVMGVAFDLGALSSLLDQTTLDLLPAIREAQQAGVLAADTSQTTFKDLLIWQAVREGVPTPARGAILRDLGHQLLGSDDANSARYLLNAAQIGDCEAALSLPKAVACLARTSPVAASILAAKALRLPLLDEQGFVQLLNTRAGGLAFHGQITGAIRCLGEALQRPLRPQSARTLRARLALLHVVSGNLEAAMTVARRVVKGPDSSHIPHEMALFMDYLDCCSYRWDDAPMKLRLEPGAEAVSHQARYAVHQSFNIVRSWGNGRVSEALTTRLHGDGTERSLTARDGVCDAFWSRVIRVQYLVSLRCFTEAEAELHELTTTIDARGSRGWHAVTESLRALLALELGDTEDAAAAAAEGIALGRRYGTGTLTLLAQAVLAITSLRTVDMRTALEHTESFGDLLGGNLPHTQAALWATLVVTEAHKGPKAAVHLVEELLPEKISPNNLLLHAPYVGSWLVRTALAAGMPEFAVRMVAETERLFQSNPDWPILGVAADHARGLVKRDAMALRSAVERHQDLFSQAQALEDLSEIVEGRDEAVRHLGLALRRYTQFGAARDSARVRHRLREHGVRRRHWKSTQRPVSGWGALTESERVIARLISAGMTNRQAARQISLSHHTVNFHLRNIYRKLDISSRIQLAMIVPSME
ncbi:helix-turn-helix transcriptional regulator [Streptomyces scopuliridis]|uniref:helix-turn-helix transcriptional regulator n=1 Tax=Streptomyces scopuliridis TaxID=452529 RepID=UPI00342B9509